ncbi:MAG: restriction endonuclease subunit S [Fibrobacter sp.]|nr:restriction endonuclease subunit S [Fibrobacter sp.]
MLPNGWIACKIKDIQTVEVQNGFSPMCVEYATRRKSLSLGALTGNSLDLTQEKFISEDCEMPSHSMLHKNDILVSRSNTKDKVGRAAVVLEDVVEYYYPDLMMRFQVDAQKADCRYVTMCLQSPAGRNYFMSHAAGTSTSMVKINKSVLESFPLCLPPLAEQKKIAETLSVWDSAIEKMEKLIECKEKIHAKLLNDCMHCADWKISSIESVATVKKGIQLNGENMISNGSYYVMNGGVVPSGYTDEWNTPENTVSISEGGNSCGFVAFNDEKFWAGGHCYTLIDVSPEVLPKFLFHYLKNKEKEIMKLRVGSGLPNIQKDSITNFEFKYPTKKEQKNIVEILDSSQKELSLLNQQLALYKKQKQGLMQKLLTGEWRV